MEQVNLDSFGDLKDNNLLLCAFHVFCSMHSQAKQAGSGNRVFHFWFVAVAQSSCLTDVFSVSDALIFNSFMYQTFNSI